MAAGIIEVVARYQYLTNTAEDCSINTFHFELSDTSDVSQHNTAINRVQSFYTGAVAPQVNAISAYLSDYINPLTGNSVKTYRLSDPLPRAPIATGTLAKNTALGNTNLPFEVSLCGSYKADPISGIPAGRLRNRIYLGPLCIAASTATAGAPSRPTAVFMADVTRAFARLKSVNTAAVAWCGYSTAGGIGWVPNYAWSDNEWDTQRRRGQSATSRTVISPL